MNYVTSVFYYCKLFLLLNLFRFFKLFVVLLLKYGKVTIFYNKALKILPLVRNLLSFFGVFLKKRNSAA